ncbi:hypothetical protein ACWTU6_28010 [Mesorhizobium sp. BHbsci]
MAEHNKKRATTFHKLIKQTKTRADLEFCFAVGTIGEKEKTVVLVRKSGFDGLRGALRAMPYRNGTEVHKAVQFSLLARGTGRLNEEGVIVLRLTPGGKAGFQQVKKRMREYFKAFSIILPDMQEAGVLTAQDMEHFEAKAKENSRYLPADDDEKLEESIATPQEAAESDETGGAGTIGHGSGGPEQSLSDVLKQGIAAAAATISTHALSLSRQIGAVQATESAPLNKKISDWLEAILAATPPQEQEAKLHNFTSRLLLMLAYPENLLNLQDAKRRRPIDRRQQDETGIVDGAGQGAAVVNGVELGSVSTDTLDQDEVIETLFHLAKAQIQERQLPYSLEMASPERIAKMVSSQWPKGEDQAARRSEIVERLIAAVKQLLHNDVKLIALLGLEKADKPEGENFAAKLAESTKAAWNAHLETALKQKDEMKSRISQIVNVEGLGGTWRHVDDIFLEINGELSEQLTAVGEQQGEARSDAIKRVEALAQKYLSYLDSNRTVALLDKPPFEVQGTVGQTLREALVGVGSALKRLKTWSATAATPAA